MPKFPQAPGSAARILAPARRAPAAAFALAAFTGAFAAYGFARAFFFHVGHDQSWCLYMAERVLSGVALDGPRLVEVNPPLIVWLSALPALAARIFGISSLTAFRWCFDLMAAGCIAWSASLFRRIVRPPALVLWGFLLALVLAALIAAPSVDIGQREHLTALLITPYALLVAGRLAGAGVRPAEATLVGLAGAMGVCLKPQQVFIVAILEVYLALCRRSWRAWLHPAFLAFAAGVLAYIACVFRFVPEYFTQIVPLLRDVYWGFNVPMREVLTDERRVAFCLAVLLLFWRGLRPRSLPAVLVLCALAAEAVFLQQHKGWTYQLFPVTYFSLLLAGLLAAERLCALLTRRKAPVAPGKAAATGRANAAACLAVFVIAAFVLAASPRRPQPQNPGEETLARIFAGYPAGTAVAYLSEGAWAFPAVVAQRKVWASRYLHLWLLPALARSVDPQDPFRAQQLSPDRVAALSEKLRRDYADDLAYWRPAVVVVDACDLSCDGLERLGFAGILGWFLASPEFHAQWSHYRYVSRTEEGQQVYVRATFDSGPLSSEPPAW